MVLSAVGVGYKVGTNGALGEALGDTVGVVEVTEVWSTLSSMAVVGTAVESGTGIVPVLGGEEPTSEGAMVVGASTKDVGELDGGAVMDVIHTVGAEDVLEDGAYVVTGKSVGDVTISTTAVDGAGDGTDEGVAGISDGHVDGEVVTEVTYDPEVTALGTQLGDKDSPMRVGESDAGTYDGDAVMMGVTMEIVGIGGEVADPDGTGDGAEETKTSDVEVDEGEALFNTVDMAGSVPTTVVEGRVGVDCTGTAKVGTISVVGTETPVGTAGVGTLSPENDVDTDGASFAADVETTVGASFEVLTVEVVTVGASLEVLEVEVVASVGASLDVLDVKVVTVGASLEVFEVEVGASLEVLEVEVVSVGASLDVVEVEVVTVGATFELLDVVTVGASLDTDEEAVGACFDPDEDELGEFCEPFDPSDESAAVGAPADLEEEVGEDFDEEESLPSG